MAKDPVCNMEVDPGTAPARADHNGTTYYFCSEACRQEFERDPEKYAAAVPAPEAAPRRRRCCRKKS
ncbi:MAG: YHS domain-containing protein [Firmicutes bacterium]|nr:YHS domain-containing protein [Bacillota bacterium]